MKELSINKAAFHQTAVNQLSTALDKPAFHQSNSRSPTKLLALQGTQRVSSDLLLTCFPTKTM
jgi:hypothetical protein